MNVMVKEAPRWVDTPIHSPLVKQTSRSTMDQVNELSYILYTLQPEKPAPAKVLCGSLARDFTDAHVDRIIGLDTSPHIDSYHSTVIADRWMLATSIRRALLTRPRKHVSVTPNLTDTMSPFPELHPRESCVDPDLKRSLGRLNYLRTLPDGWLGEDSVGSSEDVGIQAEQLLRRMRKEAPSAPLPVLGLDTDGTIVMSWSAGGLTGSMTIYGDGTYSYFVRRGGEVARASEAGINEPIAETLRLLLAA